MSVKLNLKDGVLFTENGEIVTLAQVQSASVDIVDEVAVENVNFNENEPYTVANDKGNDEEDAKKLAEWLEDNDLSNVLVYLQSKFACLVLKTSNFNIHIHISVDAQVTFESLQYLDREDIKEAISPLGLRAKFRSKLFAWRKEEVSSVLQIISSILK